MAKYYGDTCGEMNRKSGTTCRGKGTKRIGRQGTDSFRYVCGRHYKQWDADRAQELSQLKRDHQMGLHAENREAFLGVISEEYNISMCQDCRDEIRAEKYGVSPEDSFKAAAIESKMTKDRESYEGTMTSMAEAAKDFNGTYFMRHYADDVIEEEELDSLWQRVKRYMDEGVSEGSGWNAPKVKLNIVDAYNRVVEECKENLISHSFDGEGSSSAFARAVGESKRNAAKTFIGRANY